MTSLVVVRRAPGLLGVGIEVGVVLVAVLTNLLVRQLTLDDVDVAVAHAHSLLSLQESLGLSEPESFRWIQKTAMDLRLSMRQVAEGVVAHGPSVAGGDTPT